MNWYFGKVNNMILEISDVENSDLTILIPNIQWLNITVSTGKN